MLPSRASYRFCLLLLLLATPLALAAQATGSVLTVRVRDAAGGYVPMATVTADADGLRQLRTTNDSGRTTFALPQGVQLRLSVRRIGYVPVQGTITLDSAQKSLELTIGRSLPWSLDTVLVRAQRSVGGIVVAAATQQPIAGATITLTGAGQRVTSAADGGFSLPLGQQPTVTLSVRAPGFAPTFRTERLENGASGEFLILLDSLGVMPNNIVANLWDAERRISWRSVRDASIGGRELRATGASDAESALQSTRTTAERGLRVSDNVCLFINGEPAPGQTLATIAVEAVKSIELYERGGELLRSLVERWPKNAPCGRGPSAAAPSGPGAVRVAVVWTY